MLAKRRSISHNGKELHRTPVLVPSFSSKGFPEIKKIVEYSKELLEDVTLVSAYDLHYKKIEPPFDFVELIFLDSGGYEAAKDVDLSDFGDKEHIPQKWTEEMHNAVIDGWTSKTPTVLISFDHPKVRVPLDKQILRAKSLAKKRSAFINEILLKPTSDRARFLNIDEIEEQIRKLAKFDIIGVTEKELGSSVLDRMTGIARIRRALNKIGAETPIHVFGSLDTVTTPMYFIAGADIFDGLTWLRFSFEKGQTIYKQNFGAVELGIDTKAHVLDGKCWNHNYYYMKELKLEMHRYLQSGNCAEFKHHGALFEKALATTTEAIGG